MLVVHVKIPNHSNADWDLFEYAFLLAMLTSRKLCGYGRCFLGLLSGGQDWNTECLHHNHRGLSQAHLNRYKIRPVI